MPTIFGTNSNETIFGGATADEILGYLGRDSISGAEGNDTIYGNQDADTLFGGLGADVLFGGQGDDILGGYWLEPMQISYEVGVATIYVSAKEVAQNTLYGNMGNDLIYGSMDNDTIFGGQGDDRIYDDRGYSYWTDTIYGGELRDDNFGRGNVIHGNMGNDTINAWGGVVYGDSGNDSIFGSGHYIEDSATSPRDLGRTTIYGGDGDDTLAGATAMYGGAGSDLFLSTSSGYGKVMDFELSDKIQVNKLTQYDASGSAITRSVSDYVRVKTVGNDAVIQTTLWPGSGDNNWADCITLVGKAGISLQDINWVVV